MNDGQTDTTFWDERRGKIFTEKGGWIIGEDVYDHGYSMFNDLIGSKSLFQVLILHVTGRLPERALADWMEARTLGVCWPDERIWCNQIGCLAGDLRTSPIAAVCAGMLAADSRQYGPGTLRIIAEYVANAMKKKKSGMTALEIVEKHSKRRPDGVPAIPGFNRPIASGDERVIAMKRVTKQLGIKTGEHVALVEEIAEILLQKYNEDINVAGWCSAVMCDQGYTPEDNYRINCAMVYAGVIAGYVETATAAPESFFPLRCEDSDYQGKPARSVPEPG